MEAEELVRAIDRYVNSEEFRRRPAADKKRIVTYGIPLAVSIFVVKRVDIIKELEIEKSCVNSRTVATLVNSFLVDLAEHLEDKCKKGKS